MFRNLEKNSTIEKKGKSFLERTARLKGLQYKASHLRRP
jgi:hypothetical protein